jgi:hypothetical protein
MASSAGAPAGGLTRQLPAGWVRQWSRSRHQEYYSHPATGLCTWEFPAEEGCTEPQQGGGGAPAGSGQVKLWLIWLRLACVCV